MHLFAISSETARCRRQNFACRTWAGSFVDRCHHYDIFSSNKTPFHLTEGNKIQNLLSAIFLSLCQVPNCAESRRVPTFLPYNVSMGAGK